MSRSLFKNLLPVLFPAFLACCSAQTTGATSVSESPLVTEHRGITLARSGHCIEALPLLKKTGPHVTHTAAKREAGFAAIQCAMALDQRDTAVDAIRSLSREFPGDPEVLY